MNGLALLLALSTAFQSASSSSTVTLPTPFQGGRVYTSSTLHVGVRPAFDCAADDFAIGVTVQFSTMLL